MCCTQSGETIKLQSQATLESLSMFKLTPNTMTILKASYRNMKDDRPTLTISNTKSKKGATILSLVLDQNLPMAPTVGMNGRPTVRLSRLHRKLQEAHKNLVSLSKRKAMEKSGNLSAYGLRIDGNGLQLILQTCTSR